MAGDRLDINVSVQGAEQAAAQIDRVNTSVDRNTEATKKSDAGNKLHAAGMAGTVKGLGKVFEGYTKVLTIAAKVTGVISIATDAWKTGAASMDLYAAKLKEFGTIEDVNLSARKRTDSILFSVGQYMGRGQITIEQAAAYRAEIEKAFDSWKRSEITVEDLLTKIRRISQELIRMNPDADNQPFLMGSLEDMERWMIGQSEIGALTLDRANEMSGAEKTKAFVSNLEQQVMAVGKLQDLLVRRKPEKDFLDDGGTLMITEDYLEWSKEYNEVLGRRIELETKIKELQETLSFSGNMRSGLKDMMDEFGNLNVNAAQVALNSIRLGVQGVSDAIMGAIYGTATWGQTFARVGQQIIGMIVQMVVQLVASQTIIRALQAAFTASSAATTATAATSSAAAWAPAATAASIATFGGASAAGLAGFLVAMSAATATATGLAAAGGAGGMFKEGGFTGFGNPNAVAGYVHKNEFVIPSPVVEAYGVGHFEQYVKGGRGGGGASVNVGILRTRQDMRDFAATEGARMIFDELGRRSNKFNV